MSACSPVKYLGTPYLTYYKKYLGTSASRQQITTVWNLRIALCTVFSQRDCAESASFMK